MTEFETQLLAGQAILIRQVGQIAGDVRWLKQREIEREKAANGTLEDLIQGAAKKRGG